MSYFHTHGQLFHLHITLIHLMLPLEKTKASRGTVPSVQRKRKVGSEEPQAATQRATVPLGSAEAAFGGPALLRPGGNQNPGPQRRSLPENTSAQRRRWPAQHSEDNALPSGRKHLSPDFLRGGPTQQMNKVTISKTKSTFLESTC